MRPTFAIASIFAATLAAGCTDLDVGDGDPALGTEVAALGGTKCSTCDDNGLNPDALVAASTLLAPPSLVSAGLKFADGRIRPLCDPATVTIVAGGTHCRLDAPWEAWFNTDAFRGSLVTYMVHVAGKHGDLVTAIATGGYPIDLTGEFSLSPSALTLPWDVRTQSLVTAGLALAADKYANAVGICMKTELTPDCPPSYRYMELVAAGNLFEGRLEVVGGGYDTETPEMSSRVCQGRDPMGTPQPCNTYPYTVAYHAASCTYAGPWSARYPTSCDDPAGGADFDFPVQIFTEWNPLVFGGAPGYAPKL
jgi:hypothetical protein